MTTNASAAFAWLRSLFSRFDFAMLAAAVVEVPRWAVAFAAIREPTYAAIPMGLLLAWAASAGWKAYFDDRSRWLLLLINGVSLLGALFVIAPVLYAMTYMPLEEIDLSQVLPPDVLWWWAGVLAITTFVPLVQVAAVKSYRATGATQGATQDDAPVHAATPSSANAVAAAPTATLVATPDDARNSAAQPDARAVALQMAGEGCAVAQIAAQVGANPSTVRSWLRRAQNANGGTHA